MITSMEPKYFYTHIGDQVIGEILMIGVLIILSIV